MVLCSAAFFGLITTFSRLAYDAGANPLTVVETRTAAFVLVFGAFQLITGRGLGLPQRNWIATLPMSVGIMAMSIGYLASVFFIKVSLAVVLFYSFPLIVGVMATISGRERFALPKALALLIAFGGLMMAIGLESESVDWRGVALVMLGALGVACNLTFTGPYFAGVDGLTVNVWNNFWGALALGAYLLLSDSLAWPSTGTGWAALGGVATCYVLGLPLMFGALKYLPPSQTAVMFNLEPVVSIIVASLLLGEVTQPLQWLGVAIMLGALCFSALRGAKSES
ncbi:DMT family transporter [Dongia sp.]|uniref:DMT family transporter n=1 Tax=Dongia sp. TaxID=1977262 RepID=UPI003753AE4F